VREKVRESQEREGAKGEQRLPALKAKPQMHSVIKPFKRREKMLNIQLPTVSADVVS